MEEEEGVNHKSDVKEASKNLHQAESFAINRKLSHKQKKSVQGKEIENKLQGKIKEFIYGKDRKRECPGGLW